MEAEGGARLRRLGLAAALGLALTAVQTLLICVLSGEATPKDAYARLCRWDSGWYVGIAAHGYHSPTQITPESRGNVAFFPGYPLSARLLKNLTGLSDTYALPLAAQVACWGFWTYVILFLQAWRIPLRSATLGILVIVSQPAAFFMVTGYPESLFACAMLGYLYWNDRGGKRGALLAVPHGFIMTATRLVGFPLVIYPLLRAWFNDHGVHIRAGVFRKVCLLPVLGAAAGMGLILFLVYCQCRFGHWDLYFKTLEIGWGVKANYLAIVSYKTYIINPFRSRNGFIDPDWVSQVTTLLLLLAFMVLFRWEWKLARAVEDSGWRRRAGYYVCAALLLFANISGRYEVRMVGMIRYVHCIEVLLVLAVLHLLSRAPWPERTSKRWAIFALLLWIAFSFLCQLVYMHHFTHDKWVA
jgi:hypothetical protein